MGASFRNYGPRINWRGMISPAIKALLILNTAVFLLQTIVSLFVPGGSEWILRWFGLVPRAVTHGLRVWQPFTYLFLHGGLMHILLNMFVLWMFGVDVERSWGRRKFYFYYFLTGAGAGVANILVKTLMDVTSGGSAAMIVRPTEVVTIGASGAVYGVLVAAAVLFPDRQIWLIPFPVTLPMRVYVFIMGLIAFFGTLGPSGDAVSHVSHLSGMIIGYFYLRRGTFLFSLRNRYLDWRRRRARRKFEVYMRDHRDEPPSRPDNWVN
jgi:membrane associated rhomboid family serine protease